MKKLSTIKPKKGLTPKGGHTQQTKRGTGDFYGVGVKNKQGVLRDWSMGGMPRKIKNEKSPPKKLG